MSDISANGAVVTLQAFPTFGNKPIPLTAWATDTDPFDIPELEILQSEMNINGEMVSWATPKPISVNLALIPGSPDAILMGFLLENNRVGFLKPSTKDVINITVTYPNEKPKVFRMGRISAGTPHPGSSANGKKKPVTFKFVFQGVSY